ncbi:MAG: indole-3-glycerol phosphate synthase TrpC [Candidatus Binataceae bacterium]
MSSILDRIFAAKRDELRTAKAAMPVEVVVAAARHAPPARDFLAALRARRPAIIAEIKRASPSKGDIAPNLDPATVAREYAANGAAAISVLTDRHFKGSLDDLRRVRAAVETAILRKDFTFDSYQLYEARAAGADCVLLIAAMLQERELRDLARVARELGMAALVEVHDESEFALAQRLHCGLIGINNRDLRTFQTDLATSERLLADYRGDALIVAESGIDSADDIRRLHRAGARAFLVGESLLKDGQARAKLVDLTAALNSSAERAAR